MANLMTVIPPGLHRGFVALGVRNYRLYWTGQVISRVGTWMQQVSLPWLVLVLGGSPLQLGIVAALEFVPSMVLAPFGGVVADRIDKRRAIVVTQVLAAVQVVVLLALIGTAIVTMLLPSARRVSAGSLAHMRHVLGGG